MTAGCSFFSFDPDVESSEQVEGVGESPMLAALVDSGDLPPLEERLPQEPLVVEPHDEIGQYGGEWNTAILGVHDWPWLGRTVAYEKIGRASCRGRGGGTMGGSTGTQQRKKTRRPRR